MPAIVTIVLLVLLTILAGLLHIPAVERFALEKGRQYLLDNQSIDLEAEKLDYNLFALRADLRGVRIRSTASPDLPPFLEADRLRVQLRSASLLRGRLVVQTGLMQGGRIQVVTDAEGQSNLPANGGTNGEKPPADPNRLPFAIQEFNASGPLIRYADGAQGLDVRINDWSLSLNGDRRTFQHELAFTTRSPGEVAVEDRTGALRNLALALGFGPGALDIERFDAEIGETSFSVSGTLEDFADPQLDLSATVSANAAELGDLVGMENPPAGRFDVTAELRNRLDNLEVEAQVNGREVVYGEIEDAELSADVGYTAGDERVRVPSFSLTSPAGDVSGEVELSLADSGQSSARVELSRLSLRRVASIADAPIQPLARASGSVEATWPGLDFGQAEGSGDLRLNATAQAPRRDQLPVSGRVRFQLAGGRLTANLTGVRTLGARLDGSVRLQDFQGLGGRVTVDVADLAPTIEQLDAFLGRTEEEGSIAPTPASGPLRVTADLGGTTDAPTARVDLSSSGLAAGDLEGVELAALADYSPEQVSIEQSRIVWRDQIIQASGVVGLGGESPTFDLETTVENGSIETILAFLERDDPVSGSFSATATVGGTAAAPEVNASVQASDLLAYGSRLGELQTDLRTEGSRIELTSLRLDKPQPDFSDGALTASGWVDTETREYSFELGSDNLRLLTLELPSGETVRGALELAANGAGSLDDPRVNALLRARELFVGENEVGAVDLSTELANGLADIALALPRFAVDLDSEVGVEAPYPTEFTMRVNELDLEPFAITVRDEAQLTGRVNGAVRGDLDLANWRQGEVTADFDRLELAAGRQQIRTEGPLRLAYRDEGVEIEAFEIVSGRSTLTASGRLPLEEGAGAPGEIAVDGTINLEIIPALLAKSVDEAFILGILELHGTVGGSVEQVEPQLNATLDSGVIFTPGTIQPIINLNLALEADQEGVALESLSAEWSRAKITAEGFAPLELLTTNGLPIDAVETTREATLTASLNGLDFDVLEISPDLGGKLSLDVNARTPELTVEAVQAEVALTEMGLRLRDLELDQPEPVRFAVRDGRFQIEQLVLTGPETRVVGTGYAELTGDRTLDFDLEVDASAGIAGYLVEDLTMEGPVTLDVAVDGTVAEPLVDGRFELTDGRLGLESPRLDGEQLDIAITFDDSRATIETLTGTLNGGPFSASGGLGFRDGINNVDLSFEAGELFMDFPEGLRTLSRVDLRFHDAEDNLVRLDGSVTVEDGSFRERLDLQSEALAFLRSGGGLDFAQEPDPFLSRIRYNINVNSENPILIDNNLAQLEASLDLRVVGSYYRPSLLGRVVLREGGEVFLAENDYVVENGVIDFTSETRIRPALNLQARTRVAGHEITLNLTGDAEDLDTQFTSDSGLSEPDIISLLLTGRTLEDARDSGVNIAREQALSYLTGNLGGRLGRAAEESLGLSQVRVEPNLISAEGDPSARLTIGQQLTRQLNLIYSMNLVDSGDQIFVTEYDVTRRFSARGVKQSDNTYRFDFRHDLRWGLNEQRRQRRERDEGQISQVEITGDPRLPEEELRDRLDLEAGDRYDFFKTRKKVDKLQKRYEKEDRLESRVRLRRQRSGDTVDLTLNINAGPVVRFFYEPLDPPGGVRENVRRAWSRGVFEQQRVDDAEEEILRWLFQERHFSATMETEVVHPSDDETTVRFVIQEGPKFNQLELVYDGADGVEADMLTLILERTGLRAELKSSPREVVRTLTRYYNQEGYLAVEIQQPRFELDASTGSARAVIEINEGERFLIGDLSVSGADAVTEGEVLAVVRPREGRAYTPVYLEESIRNIEDLYWTRGYNDVLVNFQLTRRMEDARVDIEFQLEENRQDIVREIAVEGNRYVNDKLIRRRLLSEVGDPLISDRNDRSRSRLYETNAFSLVDLTTEPLQTAEETPGRNPLRLLARVREVSPYQLRYGAFFDTDRGPGVILDFQNRNVLGSARVLGMRARYDSDFREVRGYFSQPLLNFMPLETTSAVFRSRELRDAFITDRTGVSVQQQVEFDQHYILSYGYRFERTHTFDRDPDPFLPFDQSFNLAPFTATFTHDSRDELLDATRGNFWSNGFEYAPSGFGSDVQYVRYFGQYFRYFPFFTPQSTPFDQQAPRPRLVYASGVRVGLAQGLGGQSVVPSERFFAGGGTTVRGFRQDQLGPKDFQGLPTGGEAVFIANNEARFPIYSIFEGVGFVDVGQVYENIGDFDITSLRSATGFGLRVRTPFFLLRADYGLKLNRREGESAGAFFFSIGQAF